MMFFSENMMFFRENMMLFSENMMFFSENISILLCELRLKKYMLALYVWLITKIRP
jgi:hypothetical protein